LAANADLDVVVSGSKDGTVVMHTIRKGRYVRTLEPEGKGKLRWVGIASTGHIATYSSSDLTMNLFSINGVPLASTNVVS